MLFARRFVLVAALVLLTGPAAAQPADGVPPAGTRALLFQSTSQLGFTQFAGGALSMKWQPSATQARRLGLSLFGDLFFGSERDDQRAGLGLDYLWLRYGPTRTPVQVYTGVGPTVDVSFQRREREEYDAYRTVDVGAGVTVVLGAEWFVTPYLSVLGEYGASVTGAYRYRTLGEDDDETLYGVTLRSRGGRVGAALYF